MPDVLKWDTRLTVTRGTQVISPVDSFNPTFNTPMQAIHSLEADNVAHIVQPDTITFTMAIKAIGSAVADLTDIARKHEEFSLSLAEGRGEDWTFKSVAFNNCYITSVANNIVIDGVPTTTFNCICLEAITTR